MKMVGLIVLNQPRRLPSRSSADPAGAYIHQLNLYSNVGAPISRGDIFVVNPTEIAA